MTAPTVGDRVRVEFEGVVSELLHSGNLRVQRDNFGPVSYALVRECTVILPPVQVGDLVTAENVASLPIGTVAVSACRRDVFRRRTAELWDLASVNSHTYTDAEVVRADVCIVFLPEVTE